MQTWCECDCEGCDSGGTASPVFTHCNWELRGSAIWKDKVPTWGEFRTLCATLGVPLRPTEGG